MFIDEKKSYITDKKYKLLKRHTVQAGDLVFSSFVTEKIRVALIPGSINKAINKADCFCIRTFGEMINNRYLVYFLSTRFVYKQVEDLIHGVGRPRINTSQLKGIQVPQCTISEQKQIVNILDEQLSDILKLESDIDENIFRSEALRQSILKKAFSGQLVPQDSNDEPASELLKRIAKEKAEIEVQRKSNKAVVKKTRVKPLKKEAVQ